MPNAQGWWASGIAAVGLIGLVALVLGVREQVNGPGAVTAPDRRPLSAPQSVSTTRPLDSGMAAGAGDLLSHPRVQAYLEREGDKLALRKYFAGEDSRLDDAAAWRLIEKIESEGRVIAFEALTLKLAWLERNSGGRDEFELAAEGLLARYRQRAQEQDYDPYRDEPGFAAYKQREAEIVRRVQQMGQFPDGLTRQEYLRRELQRAREEAYGQ